MRDILTLMSAVCVCTDLWKGRIYNMVVFPAMAAGMILRTQQGGLRGLALSVMIPLAVMTVLGPFWRLTLGKGLGGGDIKLLCSAAACMEPSEFLVLFTASFLIAGLEAAVMLIKGRSSKDGICFAVPVFAGTLLYLGGIIGV